MVSAHYRSSEFSVIISAAWKTRSRTIACGSGGATQFDYLYLMCYKLTRDTLVRVRMFGPRIHSMSIDEIKTYATMKESFTISVISLNRRIGPVYPSIVFD